MNRRLLSNDKYGQTIKKILILCMVMVALAATIGCKCDAANKNVNNTSMADSSDLYVWINNGNERVQVPTSDIKKSNYHGLFRVKVNGKYGFVDSTMSVVIPCEYDGMLDFCGFLCGVCVGDKWGFIDTVGKMVHEPKFDWVSSFNERKAAVVYNGDTFYMWENGDYLDTCYNSLYR